MEHHARARAARSRERRLEQPTRIRGVRTAGFGWVEQFRWRGAARSEWVVRAGRRERGAGRVAGIGAARACGPAGECATGRGIGQRFTGCRISRIAARDGIGKRFTGCRIGWPAAGRRLGQCLIGRWVGWVAARRGIGKRFAGRWVGRFAAGRGIGKCFAWGICRCPGYCLGAAIQPDYGCGGGGGRGGRRADQSGDVRE